MVIVLLLSQSKNSSDMSYYVGLLDEAVIMYEILTRLPIKSVFRFKSVCKKWLNLITHNPRFLTDFSDHNRTNRSSSSFVLVSRGCVVSGVDDQFSQLNLSMPSLGKRFDCAKGSTNGFLYGFRLYATELFVCNPITKHVVYIPKPSHLIHLALAVDAQNNPKLGFKIIAINEADGDFKCYKFEVYSSKTTEWRVSNAAELRIPNGSQLRNFSSVFSGGNVFWSFVRHIAWFDVEEDVAGLVPCPNHSSNVVFRDPFTDSMYSEIGACNGEVSYSNLTKERDIEIWLLRDIRRRGGEDHQFEWVKIHNVRLLEQTWGNVMSKFCCTTKIRNRNAIEEALACWRFVFPLPYVGGKVMWFWMGFKVGRYGRIFSVNLRTQEVIDDHDSPVSMWPFSPTLLPCPT